MASGWIVVKFDKDDPMLKELTPYQAQEVGWFEYKEEAIEEADKLNETAPKGVWYGWEANR
jgi:hypothetical protein